MWTGVEAAFSTMPAPVVYGVSAANELTILLIFLRRATLVVLIPAFRAASPSTNVTLPRISMVRSNQPQPTSSPYGVAIAVGAAIVGHSMLIELGLFL